MAAAQQPVVEGVGEFLIVPQAHSGPGLSQKCCRSCCSFWVSATVGERRYFFSFQKFLKTTYSEQGALSCQLSGLHAYYFFRILPTITPLFGSTINKNTFTVIRFPDFCLTYMIIQTPWLFGSFEYILLFRMYI